MAKAKPKKKGAKKTPLRMPAPKNKPAPKKPIAKKPAPKKVEPKPEPVKKAAPKPVPKPEPKPTPVAPAPPVVVEKKKQYRTIAWVPIQSCGSKRAIAPGTIVEPAEWEAEILLKQEAIEEVK